MQSAPAPHTAGETPWPREVDLILSAMDAARASHPASERRESGRTPYRTRAMLKLYASRADDPPATLYTRDTDRRGLGFITPHLLPLGYGGWVTLQSPEGELIRVECTVYRCRKTVQGWYEGALTFHREAWQLGR
jgi:hypothetical protein